MEKYREISVGATIAMLLSLFAGFPANAGGNCSSDSANLYRVNSTLFCDLTVNDGGGSNCHTVFNTNSKDIMVPANIVAEWTAFAANKPSNVYVSTANNCLCTSFGAGATQGQIFYFSQGSSQTFIVPAGVSTIYAKLWGGGGGGGGSDNNGTNGGTGGGGGYSWGTLSVTPGGTLSIYVAGGGTGGTSGTNPVNKGGGGGGGGYSGIFDSGVPKFIAGGGGGGTGGDGGNSTTASGAGGGTLGVSVGSGGGGGSQVAGGTITGTGSVGASLQGGAGATGTAGGGGGAAGANGGGLGGSITTTAGTLCGGGGGGGGYYGGGGGPKLASNCKGAGGGSSYFYGGTTNSTAGSGVNSGNTADKAFLMLTSAAWSALGYNTVILGKGGAKGAQGYNITAASGGNGAVVICW